MYALTDLRDGETPGFRTIADPAEAAPGETVSGRPPSEGEVWDEANQRLRQRTDGERLAILKAEKTDEMQRAFAQETEADFGTVWEVLGVMASEPRDARLTALKTRLAKLRERVGTIEAATMEVDVEAVTW